VERRRQYQVQMHGHPYLRHHPCSEGLPPEPDWPVLVHMDRLSERVLEQTGRERLVKMERLQPAGQTLMLRAMGKGLG